MGFLSVDSIFVSHTEFSLLQNSNTENPNCVGIDGVLEAYFQSLRTVQLYGPTNFAPVINQVARWEKESHKHARTHTHTRTAYISNVHCHVKMHSKYTHSTQHKHICTQNKYLHAHSYIMSLIHKICKFPCVSYACATYLVPPWEASSFCMHVMNTNIKSERLQFLLFVFQFFSFF